MTTKFLQALGKLKPSSPEQVRSVRSQASSAPRGAVAFSADVHRRKQPASPVVARKNTVAGK